MMILSRGTEFFLHNENTFFQLTTWKFYFQNAWTLFHVTVPSNFNKSDVISSTLLHGGGFVLQKRKIIYITSLSTIIKAINTNILMPPIYVTHRRHLLCNFLNSCRICMLQRHMYVYVCIQVQQEFSRLVWNYQKKLSASNEFVCLRRAINSPHSLSICM